ncbi:hypothetical protein [Kitasatospora sp. NPDC059827]|uniref:hypothetical protein n=1 Tax=Kitasatospora sp. NPDC059827 TaxID=3346964 RepID=UPI00364D4BD2
MRKRYRWLIGSTAAAAVLAPVAYAGYALANWDGSPAAADCSKVMAFAGGSLPAEATGATCADNGGWQERGYTAEFRMPRTDLAARLAAAFPRVRLDTDTSAGLGFGNAHETDGSRPAEQATVLRLRADYEADGTARVKLDAFNT